MLQIDGSQPCAGCREDILEGARFVRIVQATRKADICADCATTLIHEQHGMLRAGGYGAPPLPVTQLIAAHWENEARKEATDGTADSR